MVVPFDSSVNVAFPHIVRAFGLPIQAIQWVVIAYTLTYIVINLMIQNYVYGKFRWPFVSELYEYIQGVYLAKAIVSVIASPRKPTFNVTNKGATLDHDHISSLALPFFLIYLLLMLGCAVAAWRYLFEPGVTNLMLVVGLWNLFNLLTAGAALGVCAERRQLERTPSLAVNRRGQLTLGGRAVDVAIERVSATVYRVSGFNWVSGLEGTYVLSVSAAGISDRAGNVGVGSAGSSWVMDTTVPAAPTGLAIVPDTGASPTDGLTNSATVVLSGNLAESGLTVRLVDVATNRDLGYADVVGTTFSKTITVTSDGRNRIQISVVDAAGNVVKEGKRELRDLAFMMKITMAFRDDPVRHEKALLDDWLRADFPRVRKN